jgi:hypothetical protein
MNSELQKKRNPIIGRLVDFVHLREEPYRPTNRTEILKMVYANSLWFALVIGFAESLFAFILRNLYSKVLHLSHHYLWMLPLIDILWLLVLGSLICLLVFRFPKQPWIKIMSFVYTFLGLLSIYYVQPKIGIIAALILFAGISFQVSVVIGQRSRTFYSMVCKSLPWMALIYLMVMVGMIGYYS